MWNENNRQLILEMATGTGKTRTALGCVKCAVKDTDRLLIVVATPQVTLTSQWEEDVRTLDVGVENTFQTYGVQGWPECLEKAIKALSAKNIPHLMVFTTHDVVCGDNRRKKVKKTC